MYPQIKTFITAIKSNTYFSKRVCVCYCVSMCVCLSVSYLLLNQKSHTHETGVIRKRNIAGRFQNRSEARSAQRAENHIFAKCANTGSQLLNPRPQNYSARLLRDSGDPEVVSLSPSEVDFFSSWIIFLLGQRILLVLAYQHTLRFFINEKRVAGDDLQVQSKRISILT